MSDKPDKGRILVRAGVTASDVKVKGRSTKDLKQRMRDVVECQIVMITEVAKKEHLRAEDIDVLAKLNKLITDLDAQVLDPENMTEEELAARAGRK